MMIGFIKIFIYITVLFAFYMKETKANKDHPNVRRNGASSESMNGNDKDDVLNQNSRRLSTDDIISITSSVKPTIAEKGTTKISNVLTELINNNAEPTDQSELIRTVENDKMVLVDVVGTVKGFEKAISDATGIAITSCYEKVCSMYVPIVKINELASYPQVASIRASTPQDTSSSSAQFTSIQPSISQTRVGTVTSEGVIAMGVDKVVEKYKLNGTGLMIGVMADSFNCLDKALLDSKSGDLPPLSNVIVLADLSSFDCYYARDQGRAMMQLIHDVAPEAKLAFYTASRGEADFANGIVQLANAGCDIIVEGYFYLNEPFFQDGILSQAIDQVVAQGVTYITAVGNEGDIAWDAPNGFVRSGILDNTVFGSEYHQFSTDSYGQPILTQRIGFPNEYRDYYFSFQWDEPALSQSISSVGSTSDLDIYFISKDTVLASGTEFNVGYDPIETFSFNPGYISSSNPIIYVDMVIKLYEGPAPKFMKLIAYNANNVIFEFGSGAYSTVSGHTNSASGISVGAAFYQNTPAFGTSPPMIESFSTRGGTPILFDKYGARQTKKVRPHPLVVGPDGVLTTFYPPDSSDFRYFGTSASASQVAAVAALLLQAKGGRKSLSPSQISNLLKGSAIDMDDPSTVPFDVGFDYKTGYGFVNASAALNTMMSDVLLPMTNCSVTWNLYNSRTDKLNAKLVNGTTIVKPPPCTRTNIEAVIPCGLANGKPVVIELYKNTGNELFHKRTENLAGYFLFGNNGANILNGRVPPGTYSIRAKVNGTYTPRTTFTLRGDLCGN